MFQITIPQMVPVFFPSNSKRRKDWPKIEVFNVIRKKLVKYPNSNKE